MSDCAGCDHPEKYGHNAYCPESRIDELKARLAEVIAERDSLRTMLLNERAEWMDEAIRRQASVNENLAALVIDAQDELRKCQQDAIHLQDRLAYVTQTLAPLVDDDNRPVEALARYAVARIAAAEDAIEAAGRCLVMSNSGAANALKILRGFKQADNATEFFKPTHALIDGRVVPIAADKSPARDE